MALGEFELIEQIHKRLGSPSARVRVGIGDDAAVLEPPPQNLIVTVDAVVEGVHFDLNFESPEEVGHKALAVNLSDIAAMAATPWYAVVSLGIREGIGVDFIEKFYSGLSSLASKYSVDIVGGNISRAAEFFADITVFGSAERYVTRAGARAGDLIAVSGALGDAAAGLSALQRWGRAAEKEFPELIQRHVTPSPRLELSAELLATGALTSLIDISDGLSSELHHLAESSQKQLQIRAESIPMTDALRRFCTITKTEPLDFALSGGEDYELLMTIDRNCVAKGLPAGITLLGEVGEGTGVTLMRNGRSEALKATGWNHLLKSGKTV